MKWRAGLLLLVSFQILALRDPFYRSNEYQIPSLDETLSAGVVGDGQCWQVWRKTEKQGWQRVWLKACSKQTIEKDLNSHFFLWWQRQVFSSQNANKSLSQKDSSLPSLLNSRVKVKQCERHHIINIMGLVKEERPIAGCNGISRI